MKNLKENISETIQKLQNQLTVLNNLLDAEDDGEIICQKCHSNPADDYCKLSYQSSGKIGAFICKDCQKAQGIFNVIR